MPTATTHLTPTSPQPEPMPTRPQSLLAWLHEGFTIWRCFAKGPRGIFDVLILALPDAADAELRGRQWVAMQPGRMFLRVEPAVVSVELPSERADAAGASGATEAAVRRSA